MLSGSIKPFCCFTMVGCNTVCVCSKIVPRHSITAKTFCIYGCIRVLSTCLPGCFQLPSENLGCAQAVLSATDSSSCTRIKSSTAGSMHPVFLSRKARACFYSADAVGKILYSVLCLLPFPALQSARFRTDAVSKYATCHFETPNQWVGNGWVRC